MTNHAHRIATGLPTWYLLYGGSSEADEAVARAHHAEIAGDPYSTGYVRIIIDAQERHVHSCAPWPAI